MKKIQFKHLFTGSRTFDSIGQICAVDVRGKQMSIVILHLPFVIDNIFKFNFRTAVIVCASTADHRHILSVCIVRMLFVASHKNTAKTKRFIVCIGVCVYKYPNNRKIFPSVIKDQQIGPSPLTLWQIQCRPSTMQSISMNPFWRDANA